MSRRAMRPRSSRELQRRRVTTQRMALAVNLTQLGLGLLFFMAILGCFLTVIH